VQTGLPDDVLVIHYGDLGSSFPSLVRLQVLAAVGRLLAAQDQDHTIGDLAEDPQVRQALRQWLLGEQARRFWQCVDDQVVSLQMCERHILVGTRHLMDDLAVLVPESPLPKLSDLDMLWQATDIFVDRQLSREQDTYGVGDG
jgi:hypothetical protein